MEIQKIYIVPIQIDVSSSASVVSEQTLVDNNWNALKPLANCFCTHHAHVVWTQTPAIVNVYAHNINKRSGKRTALRSVAAEVWARKALRLLTYNTSSAESINELGFRADIPRA